MVTFLKINKSTPFSGKSSTANSLHQNKNITKPAHFMGAMEENIKEVIVLSDLIRKQEFRACFITHFKLKVKELETLKIDVKILQRLQMKLLEPLMFHLKTTNSSMDKCTIIECIIQILKLTPVNNIIEFFDVYTIVFFQIFQEGNLPYQPSEELQHCVLECCSFLIKNSTQNVLEKVYTEESGGKFSLGISISVSIVKLEKSIKLRIAALDFLLTASQFGFEEKNKKEIYNKIGDLFMLYLPGILGPLLEVILRDETQHHSITAKALCCWGHILCLVMKDSEEKEALSDTEIIKQWLVNQKQNEIIDVTTALKENKRTKHWFKAAAIVLQPSILKLSDVRKHSHSKCRLELTNVMVKLLKNCKRNLKNCLPVMIEILVSSTIDEDIEVHQVAERALAEFEAECCENNIELLAPVIEENLYLVINKLPGIVHSGQEKLILSVLKSLSGYIRILGRLNRIYHLLSLSSTLRKLVFVIKTSFELELYPELWDQDLSIWENETNAKIWSKQWKRFKFFTDPSIKAQLEDLCQDIGKFGPSETILDFLLDTYKEDNFFKKEIILILNEVISGSEEIKDHIVDQLLDFFLDPQNLNLPLQVNHINCNNLKEAQTNIMQVALIMEGIGKLSKRVGSRFQDYLLKSLYSVLERMGSSYSVIREAATKSAIDIASACGLNGSVKSLIQNNVDYLSYHLTLKLRKNDESVFDVVTVLMKNSPFETLPNIEEIINSVLKSSSENFDSPHTLSYLRLFQTFVLCAKRWINTDEKSRTSNTTSEESGMSRLKKYIESLPKKETEEEENFGEDGGVLPEQIDDEHIPEEPKKPELPRHLKLTLAIANNCLHHLPSKDNNKKIIVLEILNECVWALADWEDDLLPLVHNIWSPLVTRFEYITDPLIINRSFTLLCTLSFTSKDFIRRRTLKNVMPALTTFLLKQAPKSKLKDSASGYFFTQNFKLQRELLANLGKLTSSLLLFERQTDMVVESALPYLSSFQPQELQEKCRIFFKDLIAHDKYLVWFKVRHLADDPEFTKNSELVLNLVK